MISKVFPAFWAGRTGFGLLLLRLVIGAAFILHGYGKMQHATSWMGPGMPAPLQFAAAFSEFGGGIALLLGLLTPLASLGIIGTMLGALLLVHFRMHHAFVAGKPGEASYELAAVYLIAAFMFLLSGPGAFSLDALLFRRHTLPRDNGLSQKFQ